MPNPSFIRREVSAMLPIWKQIRDCVEGETAIKGPFHPGHLPHEDMGAGTLGSYSGIGETGGNGGGTVYGELGYSAVRNYLPMPNPEDQSEENIARYRAYVIRAQFYPVVSRTLDGLVGQVFQRDPEITIPDAMKVMELDVDGSGLSIKQIAQKVVRGVLAYGRVGLLTDYPKTNGPATKAQLQSGDIRPVITVYDPWNIINWHTVQRGAKRVLDMVVLRETVFETDTDDDFVITERIRYRVLRLNASGNYTYELWNQTTDTATKDQTPYTLIEGPFELQDAKGEPFKDIPFKFVGAETNDWFIDKPPCADMASLNIGHYRNSGDYEESCFIAGQPTPVLTGLEQSWVDKNFPDKKLMLGSRRAILLGKESKAELLQATENGMPMEAMKHKEEQMMAIGAKLITHNKTTRTATETTVQQSSENSTLGNIAVNSGQALQDMLIVAAAFLGIIVDPTAEEKQISYTLNDDFDMAKKTPEEIAQIINIWQSGVTSWTEARVSLRASGYTSQTDVQALQEIQEEKAAAFQLGGHPIADPFGLPPGVTPPAPIPPPGSPADNAAKEKAAAAAAASNKPTPAPAKDKPAKGNK